MERKNAYLVVGPESAGNRLTTRLLISAGCFGDGELGPQRLDSLEPLTRGVTPVVWLRSVPHGREWPNLDVMIEQLRDFGYSVQAVVPTRDWTAVAYSQVQAGHCSSHSEALSNLRKAYPFIFSALAAKETPYVVVSYESLVQRPQQVARELLAMLDLESPHEFEKVIDANEKWFNSLQSRGS